MKDFPVRLNRKSLASRDHPRSSPSPQSSTGSSSSLEVRDVCSIQYGDSNCQWDIHRCPIHDKCRLTNLTTHFIRNHCILLVQILPQPYLFFSALAILACANLAIPLCTRDRVLRARRDNLLLCALQNHYLFS